VQTLSYTVGSSVRPVHISAVINLPDCLFTLANENHTFQYFSPLFTFFSRILNKPLYSPNMAGNKDRHSFMLQKLFFLVRNTNIKEEYSVGGQKSG